MGIRIRAEIIFCYPDEVIVMAEKYQLPHLCNYYCANE